MSTDWKANSTPLPCAEHQAANGSAAAQYGHARILLVEDHPICCAGLQALFSGDEALEIVGQVANGSEALALTRFYQPDIVLLDIQLGGANGLDLVNQLRRICPGVHIVVLTAHEEPEYLRTALRLGVEGYIQKDVSGQAILTALRQVLSGERVITRPQALNAVITEYGQLLQDREHDRIGLTHQELQILRMAASGLNNKDIGAHLFLSEITIKRRQQDIYRKLNVKSRAQAVAEAIRLGWI
jgi:DNA-binding NarL/FixJ family response regulator